MSSAAALKTTVACQVRSVFKITLKARISITGQNEGT